MLSPSSSSHDRPRCSATPSSYLGFASNVPSNALAILLFSTEKQQVDSRILSKFRLARVVAALALTRYHLNHVDLALIPVGRFDEYGLVCAASCGETPDAVVNSWHHDIMEMSEAGISTLATVIHEHGCIKRIQKTKVLDAIRKFVRKGCIDSAKVNQALRKSLEGRGIQFE